MLHYFAFLFPVVIDACTCLNTSTLDEPVSYARSPKLIGAERMTQYGGSIWLIGWLGWLMAVPAYAGIGELVKAAYSRGENGCPGGINYHAYQVSEPVSPDKLQNEPAYIRKSACRRPCVAKRSADFLSHGRRPTE